MDGRVRGAASFAEPSADSMFGPLALLTFEPPKTPCHAPHGLACIAYLDPPPAATVLDVLMIGLASLSSPLLSH